MGEPTGRQEKQNNLNTNTEQKMDMVSIKNINNNPQPIVKGLRVIHHQPTVKGLGSIHHQPIVKRLGLIH